MSSLNPLDCSSLRWRCDARGLECASSEELPDLEGILGQDRAQNALQFGVSIRREGYHLYVMGPPGMGKRTAVMQTLAERSTCEGTPSDWIYVNNFEDLRKPRAIAVPAGRGAVLRQDVQHLVEDLENAIPAALENDEHKSHLQEVEREADERQSSSFQALAQQAHDKNIQLIRTPSGFALAPLKNGEVLSPEEYHKLPEEDRKEIEATVAGLQDQLQHLIEQVPKWHKETRDRIKALNREAARLAVGHLMAKIKQRYADLPQVVAYLEETEKDVIDRVDEFQPAEEGPPALFGPRNNRPSLEDYEINLLVDHGPTSGAPVVYLDHPTMHNLVGRVEHESHMGALTTDFTLIKSGALHQANGGYLILDVQRLLTQPYAWEALKRALTSHSIKIESLGESLSLISTVSLEPEPIPLDVKIILLGDRLLYYLLYEYDPDFPELFKVSADFDEHVERNPENCRLFARFLATLARREGCLPLDQTAIARLLEHAARVAEDATRLSTHMRTLADVLREADHWAVQAGAPRILAEHVRTAIDQQIARADRVRHLIHDEIHRGTILIDTAGERVGQVNGLSVIDMGNFRFGQPSRISATARLGRGEVIDIEREAKLGGAIHSKGVLILSSLLAARFAARRPLPVSASLVFEQSYGMIEGDSASVAEYVALVSVLADVPVKQNLAVTGSVNQLGQVQAIGGVNEKIEGFFDVCRRRELSGDQGVLIPDSNVKHLMLRDDVVEACASGKFRIFAVRTVDEALTLLTGLPAGEADGQGNYPEGSVNDRATRRIDEFIQLRQRFGDAKPRRRGDEPAE